MKLSCEIIQDLLPLYIDDVCSSESRKAVEEHLSHCPICRQYLEMIRQPDIAVSPEAVPVAQERIMKSGFQKLRQRWLLSVLLVFLLFPLLLLGIMGVHEYRGEGIAFTNLDEIFVAKRLMSLIENQHFEKAADLVDFETKYQEIQEILNQTPEDYLPSVELFTVNEELWIAKTCLEDLRPLSEEGDHLEFWIDIVLSNRYGILIPESVWAQIHQSLGDSMEYDEVKDTYCLIDTPWGQFYVDRNYGEQLREADEITAELLFPSMDFVPYEIYQTAQESLEQEALEWYQSNQAYYAFAANMTQEEFIQAMKHKFCQMLETNYASGVTIFNSHISGAYRYDQHWNIEISAMERQPSGESVRVNYQFKIQHGKLHIIAFSTKLYTDPIADALSLPHP